ncbi:MAG: phosphotransferase [Verrucomicrobia bacterium]|nr:phosphotransferase [Verrucomicrobiota bacterium]
MNVENLISKTRSRFPGLERDAVEITALDKGGSDRRYYRVAMSADHSLILVKYDRQKAENARFVAIANFLKASGVNAPAVYHHDPGEGLIWMQDLGDEDLWHYRDQPWAVRKALYEQVLDQAATVHAAERGVAGELGLLPGFDEALYRWEQRYAFENCFNLYFGIPRHRTATLAQEPAFARLAAGLCRYRQQLIHRDLQSQNVLVWDGQTYLIDFQGMRAGLSAYDLASLLYDPYVSFTPEERVALLRYYHVRAGVPMGLDEFTTLFRKCALQRLLQALGAYGTIGILRHKPEFLRHIGPALRRLQEVASEVEGFTFLADFTARLPDRPNLNPQQRL